jgi:prepilin-type N-terminal cleavage/methylation domain-containing protein
MSSNSGRSQAGFTLLELVIAITMFAFIVVEVLADREASILLSGDARVVQTVRYLAQSKIDEIKFKADDYGERDGGDFADLDPENPEKFRNYTWELEIKRVIAVGSSEDGNDEYLFSDDEGSEPTQGSDGEPVAPRYVRRLTLTVAYEPEGEVRGDLSIRIVTYIPDNPEEEEQ